MTDVSYCTGGLSIGRRSEFLRWSGIYNSSKAAETWISETLRIEMEPLGVRVLTAMVGEVQTKIYQNNEPAKLPEGSYYSSVAKFIFDQGSGLMQTNNEDANVTAKNLVKDVMNGSRGQVWRGGVAGTARLASWLLPTRVFVSPRGLLGCVCQADDCRRRDFFTHPGVYMKSPRLESG